MDESSVNQVRTSALTPDRVAASAIQQAAQLERALQAWAADQDALAVLAEGREDY